MSETKKEGPWFAVQPGYANGWWVVSRDDEGCDTVDDSSDGGFTEPIARLIASAPELLSLVSAILDNRGRCYIPNNEDGLLGWDEKASAAIAKATGQTP